MGNNLNKEEQKLNQKFKETEKKIFLNREVITLKYKTKISDKLENAESKQKEEEEDCNQNQDENSDDSFKFDDEPKTLSPKIIEENVKDYPYNSVGTLTVKFSNEELEYTCFLIYFNVVITLASNLINKNGEKAKYIITSFSNEEIKWENIYIEEDKENKKNKNVNLKKNNNKLAAIIYKNIINEDYLGVEKVDFIYISLDAIISNGYKKINNIYSENINIEELKKENQNEKQYESALIKAKIDINEELKINNIKTNEDKELVKRISGSPMINKDYNGGYYVIAIIDESYEYQYFSKNNMLFLFDMVDKGKSILKKDHGLIIKDKISELHLSNKNIGNMAIKYLMEFNFEKLTFLDLSKNKINSNGVSYLSQMKLDNLEFLNLNNNEIKDEGLDYISDAPFKWLSKLHLSNTKISYKGIKNFVYAIFINKLKVLTFSNNPKIGDIGVKYISKCQNWKNLKLLVLSKTKLTNKGIGYLYDAKMPKLRKLYIASNNINDSSKDYNNYNDKLKIKYICLDSKKDYQYIEDQKDNNDDDKDDDDYDHIHDYGECLACKKYILNSLNFDKKDQY